MSNDVKEFDTYTIERSGIITDFDQKVIYRLYQPIIGHCATALYFTLLSESNVNSIIANHRLHSRLYSIMQISSPEFIAARKKLEGIGLLNTKVKEHENHIALEYLYILHSPKAPNDFFKDPILNSLLLQKLGEDEFYRTQYFYSDNHYSNDAYADITSTFEESFEKSQASTVSISSHYSEKVTQNISSDFDMDHFILKMADHLIPKAVFTVAVRKEILRVKLLFNLSDTVLESCVVASIEMGQNNKKTMNLSKFNQIVEEMTQNENENREDTPDSLFFCKKLDSTDPFNYYRELLGISALFKDDLLMIKEFVDMNIPKGVINATLWYCYTYKKGDYNFKGYVNRVMSSVVKEKCRDAYQTYLYFKQRKMVKPIETQKDMDASKNATNAQENPISDDLLKEIAKKWCK